MQSSILRFKTLIVLCFTIAFCISFAEPAFARRRSRSRSNAAAAKARREKTITAAQSQYAAAQSVLAAAQGAGAGAEARLQAVLAEMNGAASELRNARSASKEIALDLAEIEEDILSEQSADSSYARLVEEIRTTKLQMTQAEKRLTKSPDFIRRYEQARATDGGPAAFRLRQTALANDPAYTLHKSTLTALGDKQEALKRELFHKDKEWLETQAQLAEAHRDEREAATDLYRSAKDKSEPKQQIKTAQQAVAAARESMAQSQQILSKLGASTAPTKSGNSKTKK